MAEIGLDISREFPKPLTGDQVQAPDVVITMGCGDACPVYTGKRYLDCELPDHAGLPVEQVRPIREKIGRRVLRCWTSLADRLHHSVHSIPTVVAIHPDFRPVHRHRPKPTSLTA
jgi:hypothetical protein